MGTQKIVISEENEGSMDKRETSDSYVVDIENFSHGIDKDVTSNSIISVKLLRNLSRKVSQRGKRNKTTLTTGSNGGVADGSRKVGACNPGNTITVPLKGLEAKEEPIISPQSEETIAITSQSRCRSFGKYHKYSWSMGPRRILLLLASLSSMGTILLIYFTLSISKFSGDDTSYTQ